MDIRAQHASLQPELDETISRVVASGRYIGGPEVERLEEAFARWCHTRHAIGCSSGTDALTLCLRAADVGRGDEVITTSFTFIATAESIVEAGARPVLVDPSPHTGLMEPAAVAQAIGPRTAAIVVVHLYGQPVNLDGFRRLADERGLLLVEDAAQAHGAQWNGRPAGSVGDAAAFSFFPGKNLGALGDAGGITTDDDNLAARIRRLRDHGRSSKHVHAELGVNARMDPIQAAVLTLKLPRVNVWNDARRQHAAAYDRAFQGSAVRPLVTAPAAQHVYHQYVVRVDERDAAAARLAGEGVATGVHYPLPISRQAALAELGVADDHPNADRLARTVLSLPVYPELQPEARGAIAASLLAHAAASAGITV